MGMTKKTELKGDHLFELFAGEYVSIILDMQIESVFQGAESIDMVKTPLNVSGYLTDEDDVYFYLGHEPNVYNQAVKKNMVIHIEVVEETVEKEESFKNVKGPDGKGYN
jgi:hypothetical protein